ncbi:MAG: hypothetical protein PHR77_05505 [Kiritimatiellae bacterium]|nr:hypothetical protein [Kiritimatiellia bacterium]MDD5520610.1 hypothetical protein [Kiritimatiellia bacterium]
MFVEEERRESVILWGKFPFFAKFLGSNVELQANVLQLATDNADLMKNLLDRLRSISPVISTKVEDGSGKGPG